MNRPLLDAFLEYTAAYDADDPKIRLKIDHSLRVADLSERIAASCHEEEAGAVDATGSAIAIDPALAWEIGLLHDIGRFEQVRRFGTFVDAVSVNHAEFGADLLFREGLIQRLDGHAREHGCPGEQSRPWEHEMDRKYRLMERSIRCHNAYRIPEDLSPEESAYSNVLRDADKVDIFRVLCDTPVEEIYSVTSEQLRSAEVTEEVKNCFMNRTAVPRNLKRTPIDNIVGHICLYFELVYEVSRKTAREQGYLDRLLVFRSENKETEEWFAFMREQLGRAGN